MKNSGFTFHLSEETTIWFTLKAKVDLLKNITLDLAICLLEIMDDFKFRFLIEENFKSGNEFLSEEMTLRPNKNGYMVICLNY